ncbi:hypothetical protein GTW51_18950 [Aurantimonas aggregata]|uniref:Uncharacterized protein n=1 Tax=Aurantimonas aggregata TaxID=2047720 RepID=A0A6L9MLR8_9HYPH|nr:hypothetical protein [Aurantimonas aggregata]NDV88777.1 hypothetical protein [Aurantimonas aggregata]
MSTVVAFNPSHVLISSGRCTGGDDRHLIGRWVHMVDFVDEEGGVLHDYVGTDCAKADEAAVAWARDVGCRIIDRSSQEPDR